MTQGGEPVIKNGFVDGNYSVDSGETVYSLSNNILTLTSWKATSLANLSLPIIEEISFQSGDTIRVLVKKTAGTGFSLFTNVMIGSTTILSNKSWATGNTALDETVSAPSNFSGQNVRFRNRSANKTSLNCKYSVTIYKNGVQILPEV